MGRLIQAKIKEPLVDEILFGKLVDGGIAHVEVKDGKIEIVCEPRAKSDDDEPPARPREKVPVN